LKGEALELALMSQINKLEKIEYKLNAIKGN